MIRLSGFALAVVSGVCLPQSSDQWSATLQPSNGSPVSGKATVAGIGSADSTVVKLTIRGASPGATVAWHIRSGTCAAPGAIFGSESAYTRLRADGTGSASASATLPIRPRKAAAYVIQVHRGNPTPASPGGDVLACGDLRPVLNKMPTG